MSIHKVNIHAPCIFFFLLALLCSGRQVHAGEIKIGLYYGLPVKTLVFSVVEGEYSLMADGGLIAVVRKGTMFHIALEGELLEISDTSVTYGSFSRLVFNGTSATNIFQVKSITPSFPSKESDDDLAIAGVNGALRLINSLDIEKYIPGTVESEGGSVANPEYYKAQAVLARTYAVRNFSRHAQDGFNLCDDVHCQAYNGKSRMNKEIYAATLKTKNEILTDKNGEPVVTAYHSNCGGITGSSQVVWNRVLLYLRPVHDPFCEKSAYRNWSKTIPVAEWGAYLKSRGYAGDPLKASLPDNGRQKSLEVEGTLINLTDIRQQFGLKSSYLSIEINGNSVSFKGHGYGHGLGLCQQGAMEMARVGYSYVDILMFYFRGVILGMQ